MQVMACTNEFSSPRAFVNFTAHRVTQAVAGVSLLFDTGASTSLLSPRAFEYFKTNGRVRRKIDVLPNIANASGTRMATDGVYDISFYFNEKLCHGIFIVTPQLSGEAILGMNIISYYGMTLDPMNKRVTMSKYVPLPEIKNVSDEGNVCTISSVSFSNTGKADWLVQVAQATSIDPMTSARVRCRLVHPQTKKPLLAKHTFLADFEGLMAFAITSSDDGAFKPHMPNADMVCRQFSRGDIIGTAHPLDDVSFLVDEDHVVGAVQANTPPPKPHNREERKKIYADVGETIQKSDIPAEHRLQYMKLLCSYEDVFSVDKLDLGLTDVIQHTIDLKDKAMPAYKGQFRLAMDQLQLIKDNVAGWIGAGLIERSNSKFNAPVFCVPKREGQGLRVVLDYRMLNERSVPDRYSIRTIDQCLEEIGRCGSRVFTCLDLTNGFWQLKIREDDKPFTAFTIPGQGQFQWLVTPQGLMGAPASFSRLMDTIMADAENIITYIDDVLIHSQDHDDHLTHLEEALKRIRKAHLRLNVGKCIFGAIKVQYLGHMLTDKGVTPGKDKTEAVKTAPPPTTPKQLRAFLGLANYFRTFIPRFAQAAAPLFALTRKETMWKGGNLPDEALVAFKHIREAIASKPVMAFPTRHGKFTLITDGAAGDKKSSGGLGAVLLQRQETGENRPIGYASRQLLKYEENYPAFLVEMAAAVFGMEYFHHYLVGRRFNLLTDHKPLVPLSTTHTKTLNRLQLKMQDMHPDVGYIPGEDNVVSDFLSRYRGMDKNTHEATCQNLTHINGVGIDSIDISPDTLLGAQRLSPGVTEAADMLKAGNHQRGEKPLYYPRIRQNITWMPNSWCVGMVPRPRKGIVMPKGPLPLIPPSLRQNILREAHNSAIGGHTGTFRTAEALKQIVWWPSMDSDIEKHIKECAVCGANPTTTKKKQGPLQPLPIPSRPHERIHIDLFGPLKTSTSGNKFVLVWTDALTRMTKLKAIKDKAAETVAQTLLDLIYVTGVPKQIHSDQGLEFCNELLTHIYKGLDIEHSTTTPYHPQANAAAERFNRTMISYLTKAIADAERSTLDWELYLGPLSLSYNAGVNKSTRMSPFYATFGFSPTLPMWQGLEETPVQNHTYAEALTKLHHTQNTARRICQQNTQAEQQRATRNEAQQDYPQYKTTDTVWVHVNAKIGPNPKLAQKHEPGMIVECLTRNVFKVLRYNRSRKKRATLNISHLRHRTAKHERDDHYREVITREHEHLARSNTQQQEEEQDTKEERQEDDNQERQENDDETANTDNNEDGPEEETTARPAEETRRRSPRLLAMAEAVDADAMSDIAHLIPKEARKLPFLQAVAFIPPHKMDFDQVLRLVERGWSVGLSLGKAASGADQGARPRRHQPATLAAATRQSSTSLATRRLMDHNQAGRTEGTNPKFERGTSTRRTKASEAITRMKKAGKTAMKKGRAKIANKAASLNNPFGELFPRSPEGASSVQRHSVQDNSRENAQGQHP